MLISSNMDFHKHSVDRFTYSIVIKQGTAVLAIATAEKAMI